MGNQVSLQLIKGKVPGALRDPSARRSCRSWDRIEAEENGDGQFAPAVVESLAATPEQVGAGHIEEEGFGSAMGESNLGGV